MRSSPTWLLAVALAAAPLAAAADDMPYDHHTRMTQKAKIAEVQRIDHGRNAGVQLVVDTDLERITVHLGPATFVDAQPMKLQAGDEIEITGSWISLGVPGREEPYMVAEKISRAGQVMRLRDEAGHPLWRRPGSPRPSA